MGIYLKIESQNGSKKLGIKNLAQEATGIAETQTNIALRLAARAPVYFTVTVDASISPF